MRRLIFTFRRAGGHPEQQGESGHVCGGDSTRTHTHKSDTCSHARVANTNTQGRRKCKYLTMIAACKQGVRIRTHTVINVCVVCRCHILSLRSELAE